MRIFVDTNIVSELLEERSQVDYIDRIFEKAEQEGWTRVLSVGSFYTITFLTERFLRRQGNWTAPVSRTAANNIVFFIASV
jgi:hypothetical protein